MADRRARGPAAGTLVAVSLVLPLLSGCAMLNGFLDPTKVGQFPREYTEGGIRRALTPRDAPPGLPNATEPTEEDLVPIYEDYRLAAGDVVSVDIYDLQNTGGAERAQLQVSPTGNLRLPLLGNVPAIGLTELELEDDLKMRYRDAELLGSDADIRVFIQTRNERTFVVRGSVGQAGVYSLNNPDTRLLDVVGIIRDIGSNVQRLYVIRRGARLANRGALPPEAAPLDQPLIEPPPLDEGDFMPTMSSAGSAGARPQTTQRAQDQGADQRKAELEALYGDDGVPASQRASQTDDGITPLRPIIFDPQTGELQEITPETKSAERKAQDELPAPIDLTPDEAREPFDWEDVPEVELEQRVIEINAQALLAGDPRYNIVVRPKDVINVPIDTGLFYVWGEVSRPGVYAFNGRDITIKQAIAMTGGFSALAWPQRCEIVRHERGTDKQVTIPVNLDAVFAGLDDDVYLRDDDIVHVGTHFVAPFLFVIRNSFRFTYGFGFVYDRNFADKDAYGSKVNPQTLEIQRRQQSGLPF